MRLLRACVLSMGYYHTWENALSSLMREVAVTHRLFTTFHSNSPTQHLTPAVLQFTCSSHWNLPVWEHRILNVQSFTPRLKPVYVAPHVSPKLFRVVPGRREDSAVRSIRCMLSAALRGEVRLKTPRCFTCISLCCCTESPSKPPECLLPQDRSAVIQALDWVFYPEKHCCWGRFLNFHAAFPRPSCFCVQLWSPLLEFNAKRRHPGPLKGRGLLQKFLTSASGKAVNYELDVVDAAGGF